LLNPRRDARCKMEGSHVFRQVVFKKLLDVAHHPNDLFSALSKAQCRRGKNQPFSTSHEKFRVEFIGKAMKLEAGVIVDIASLRQRAPP
jgi:hypothetical protein